MFIIDPDGYVIRKWQSKELDNGVLSGRFILPEYPKVGFWIIRVEAQGQRNEKAIKVFLEIISNNYETKNIDESGFSMKTECKPICLTVG